MPKKSRKSSSADTLSRLRAVESDLTNLLDRTPNDYSRWPIDGDSVVRKSVAKLEYVASRVADEYRIAQAINILNRVPQSEVRESAGRVLAALVRLRVAIRAEAKGTGKSRKAAQKKLTPPPEGSTDRAHWDSIIANYPKLQKARKYIAGAVPRLQRVAANGQATLKDAQGMVGNAVTALRQSLPLISDSVGWQEYESFETTVKKLVGISNSLNSPGPVSHGKLAANLEPIIMTLQGMDRTLVEAIRAGQSDLQLLARGYLERDRGANRPVRPARSRKAAPAANNLYAIARRIYQDGFAMHNPMRPDDLQKRLRDLGILIPRALTLLKQQPPEVTKLDSYSAAVARLQKALDLLKYVDTESAQTKIQTLGVYTYTGGMAMADLTKEIRDAGR